jgi:hypothetical protein
MEDETSLMRSIALRFEEGAHGPIAVEEPRRIATAIEPEIERIERADAAGEEVDRTRWRR